MSRRNRIALATLLTAVVAGIVGYWLWPSPPPAVTWERLRNVPPGGTRAEIYEAAGGPPGDYRRHGFVGTTPNMPAGYNLADAETWTVDEGEVHIWFGPDGRSNNYLGLPSHDLRLPFFERVKNALGL